MRSIFRFIPLASLALAGTLPARAASSESAELQQLREQLAALQEQVKVIARQLEIRSEAEAARSGTEPRVSASDRGYSITSSDGATSIRFRGHVQLDHHLFFDDGDGVSRNAFVLRRARIISEGQIGKNSGFQLLAEFGGGSVSILDANFSYTLDPALQLKIGKFKSPVGLELLESDSWTFFTERSLVTNLVPNRDIGVQASGDIFGGKLNYTLALLNGVPDGANSNNSDFDNDKDGVARLFASPFREDAGSPLQGLALGIGASTGREKSASGRTAAYRTDGQQAFFTYNAATIADGETWRLSPQMDYRYGPFGLLGEYAVSAVTVRPSATGVKTELKNHAWQVSAGYVLTGEDSTPTGLVPKNRFNWSAGTWGAFELVARYADLRVDDAAFPLYASAATNADRARSTAIGLNWYLNPEVLFKFDLEQTSFAFAPGAPATSSTQILRHDEQALLTRFQFAF